MAVNYAHLGFAPEKLGLVQSSNHRKVYDTLEMRISRRGSLGELGATQFAKANELYAMPVRGNTLFWGILTTTQI